MSRIRANKITNQAADGAPTVENGLIISGVTTVTTLDLNGDLDVDGHLNADNVSIAGVVTATSFVGSLSGGSVSGTSGAFTGNLDVNSDTSKLKIGAGDDFQFFHNGSNNFIETNNGDIRIKTSDSSGNLTFTAGGSTERLRISQTGSLGIGTAAPQVQTHIFGADAELLIERGGYSEAELWLGFPSGQPFIASGPGKGLKLGGNGKWSEGLQITSGGVIQTGSKTITGGTNLAIQGYAVKGVWSGSPAVGKEIELISGYDSGVKMAAIGYNLTDTTLGSTYGGDLVLHTQPLYGSPTTPIPEVMRLSSSGYITTPKNVVFEVTTNGGQQLTNATVAKVEFNNVVNQRGVTFDTSNYRFTAPVAGYYHFDLFIYTYYTRFVECDSRVNGASTGSKIYRLTTYVGPNDQNPCPVMGSWTQYLAKGDYVEQYIYVTTSHGSHRQIYGDTNRKPTWWAGYLVG